MPPGLASVVGWTRRGSLPDFTERRALGGGGGDGAGRGGGGGAAGACLGGRLDETRLYAAIYRDARLGGMRHDSVGALGEQAALGQLVKERDRKSVGEG